MLLIFHLLVVLVHRFVSNTRTFEMSNKVYANETDVPRGINYNVQEPVETNNN